MNGSLLHTMVRHELRVLMRSKWLLNFTLLFFALSFLLYFYGLQTSGGDSNGQAYNRSIAMLINLSLWIIPMICLILGTNSLVSDKEEGRLSLYQTYRSSTILYVMSKYISLCSSLIASLVIAYGIFGIILFKQNLVNISILTIFLLLNILLVLVFASISLFIGTISSTRTQSFSYSILVWSFMVFLFEFLLFLVISLIPYHLKLKGMFAAVLLNPIESIRIWVIHELNATYIFGPEFLILTEWGKSGTLSLAVFSSLLTIILLFLFLSASMISRKR